MAPLDTPGVNEMPSIVTGRFTGPIFLPGVPKDSPSNGGGVGRQSVPNTARGNNPYEQSRPELERIAKDPAIAKAMDDYYARSEYTDENGYKGELGFYVMEDSAGRLSVQPYPIARAWIDREGLHTVPGELPLMDRAAIFFQSKACQRFSSSSKGRRDLEYRSQPQRCGILL